MKNIFLFIIAIFLFSCNKVQKQNNDNIEPKLISFKVETPADSIENQLFQKNIGKLVDVVYATDTVYASYYQLVNECMKKSGDIVVKGDSITLLITESGKACKALETNIIKVAILNPKNKTFKFTTKDEYIFN